MRRTIALQAARGNMCISSPTYHNGLGHLSRPLLRSVLICNARSARILQFADQLLTQASNLIVLEDAYDGISSILACHMRSMHKRSLLFSTAIQDGRCKFAVSMRSLDGEMQEARP